MRLYVLRTFWHTIAICEHFRAIIFYNFRHVLTQQQCIDELNTIFGDEAPSRTSVYRWYGGFNPGCRSLQVKFRGRRLKLVVVPETIDAVRQPILQGRHVIVGVSKHVYDIVTGDES